MFELLALLDRDLPALWPVRTTRAQACRSRSIQGPLITSFEILFLLIPCMRVGC